MPDSRPIDVHAHAVPPAVITEIERHGDRYGMSVESTPQGPVITLPGGQKIRAVIAGLLDFAERVRLMDEGGIATQLVAPWTDVQGFELAPKAGVEWARLLNDAIAEACAPFHGRLTALGTVPFGDIAASVRELERLKRELRMPAVMISTNPGSTSLADPALDDLWSAAEALAVPFILHPPSLSPVAHLAGGPEFGNLWFRLVDTTLVASQMLLAGVLDRHPGLQVVLVHGGGFLPYQVGRFDRNVVVGAHPSATMSASPSAELRRFHYDTCVMSPAAIRLLADAVGSDRIVLGSDYPFPIGDPDPVATVHAAGLDAGADQQVLEKNATALLGLQVQQ